MVDDIKHRLFFALWPSNDIRDSIVARFSQSPQAGLRAKQVVTHNLHITLHFIGNVTDQQRQCLHLAAKSIKTESFTLQLDRYGHFYQARVFWLGCHQLPDALKQLHARLAEVFVNCGYMAEKRPYAPHVTLLRKLLKPGPIVQPAPIAWPVSDFVMVESITNQEGVLYRVIERYPLG
ncbi:MAG TPA: RNA 2',3'-cyclic phosphodiesterase [Gammaproteobacteria bacterium]